LHIASAEGDESLVKYFYGVRASASIADHQGKEMVFFMASYERLINGLFFYLKTGTCDARPLEQKGLSK